MQETTCSIHAAAAAAYRCEGCGLFLCDECVEVGHRLLFCRHCGERAIPLDAGAPAVSTDLHRRRRQDAPYSTGAALAYPFRGLGLHMLLGYLVLRALLPLAGLFAMPSFGCVGGFVAIAAGVLRILFAIAIFLLLPGLLFEIVRTTAEGDNELPDWPDLGDVWARLGEVLGMLAIGLGCGIPIVILLRLFGCTLENLIDGGNARCLAAIVLGVPIGLSMWVPTVGAVGTFQSWWLAPRIDLHFKALRMLGREAIKTIALVGLFLIAGEVMHRIVSAVEPLVGAAVGDTIGLYALMVGAHLVGVLFRRHARALEALYIGVVGDQNTSGGVRL